MDTLYMRKCVGMSINVCMYFLSCGSVAAGFDYMQDLHFVIAILTSTCLQMWDQLERLPQWLTLQRHFNMHSICKCPAFITFILCFSTQFWPLKVLLHGFALNHSFTAYGATYKIVFMMTNYTVWKINFYAANVQCCFLDSCFSLASLQPRLMFVYLKYTTVKCTSCTSVHFL